MDTPGRAGLLGIDSEWGGEWGNGRVLAEDPSIKAQFLEVVRADYCGGTPVQAAIGRVRHFVPYVLVLHCSTALHRFVRTPLAPSLI